MRREGVYIGGRGSRNRRHLPDHLRRHRPSCPASTPKSTSATTRPGADPALKGKAAIANAQLAYQAYEEIFTSDRWHTLQTHGASPQRPLWASTGVKNPDLAGTQPMSRHEGHESSAMAFAGGRDDQEIVGLAAPMSAMAACTRKISHGGCCRSLSG
jgi:hypothetical protein